MNNSVLMRKDNLNNRKPVSFKVDEIKEVTDVREFITALIKSYKLAFHPDTPFSDYVDSENGNKLFNAPDAQQLCVLMDRFFFICDNNDVDLYEVALKVTQAVQREHIGMRRKIGNEGRPAKRKWR